MSAAKKTVVSTPAAHRVRWRVIGFGAGETAVRFLPGQEPIVEAQSWITARALAGKELGITELECIELEQIT